MTDDSERVVVGARGRRTNAYHRRGGDGLPACGAGPREADAWTVVERAAAADLYDPCQRGSCFGSPNNLGVGKHPADIIADAARGGDD